MSITDAVKDEQIMAFVGVPLMVGLFDGDREIDDENYERQPATFSEPKADAGSSVRFVENVEELQYQPMKNRHYDGFGLFDVAGTLRATFPLLEARDMLSGDNPVFRAGSLRIGMP